MTIEIKKLRITQWGEQTRQDPLGQGLELRFKDSVMINLIGSCLMLRFRLIMLFQTNINALVDCLHL